MLRTLLVAPVTRPMRGVPTEVLLGRVDGLVEKCAVTLDNVSLADEACFTSFLGRLSAARRAEVCTALRAATGC